MRSGGTSGTGSGYPLIGLALLCVVFAICGAKLSNAEEQKLRAVQLPSGNIVQLEAMGFVRASDGWAVTFSYVSEIDLQSVDAVRSEAAELFETHLKKVADASDPRIVAAVLYASNEPKVLDGRARSRSRYASVFRRHPKGVWTILPRK